MRAQWRVREGAKLSREEEDKNIENILERTAVLDSAVRAVGLQKMLTKSWNEEKNSYVIMSKLNQKQKNKLNNLIFNRYNDI